MTLSRLLTNGADRLARSGVPDARLDARLLLQHAMDIGHAALISRMNDPAPAETAALYARLLERRAAGEPVSRIVGRREFHGLPFEISPAVLDPRPETELLVERALADHRGQAPLFADIGTGSGAIAVALLVNLPGARAIAADISPAALEVARRNAQANGVADRFEAVLSDNFGQVPGGLDFIVANPPYIPSKDIPALSREVRDHDPLLALDGGEDGYDAYRLILRQGIGKVRPGGRIYLEMGAGQRETIASIARCCGWTVEGAFPDLAGIDRVLDASAPLADERREGA